MSHVALIYKQLIWTSKMSFNSSWPVWSCDLGITAENPVVMITAGTLCSIFFVVHTHVRSVGSLLHLPPAWSSAWQLGLAGQGIPRHYRTAQAKRQIFTGCYFPNEVALGRLAACGLPICAGTRTHTSSHPSAGDIEDSEVHFFHCNPTYERDS